MPITERELRARFGTRKPKKTHTVVPGEVLMTLKQNLTAGDRVAYAAKFLKDTGQFTGAGPQRRGVFMAYDPMPGYARVRWDDFDMAACAAQWGEDYAADAQAHGQLVCASNIAKVGSARFASNDL